MMNMSNATNNVTADSSMFTEEYVIFNYIMVGISCGLLLFVIIIAKLLCIFNRNSEYDDLNSSDRIVREKSLFATDELENITDEIKRSSSSSSTTHNLPASVFKPRSAVSDYHRGVKGVWHTPQTPPNDLDDYFVSGYETHRLESPNFPDTSQSAPVDDPFIAERNRHHHRCQWLLPRLHRALTAVNTSAPEFHSFATHFTLRDTETELNSTLHDSHKQLSQHHVKNSI